jgi:Adenylate and Guanylate cyclase catalytic domain
MPLIIPRNILPDGSNGIHIVFRNPCTESFTYQVNGPKVEYLGVGDRHDKKYDSWSLHGTLINTSGLREGSVYTGAKPDDEFCPMTLQICPSDVMKADFTDRNPVVFTVAAVFIFAFTALVFYLYDVTVERRQTKVLDSAVRSGAIVSSLFPSNVRDRLYAAPETERTPKNKFEAFLNKNTKGEHDLMVTGNASSSNAPFMGNPIAELYPDTSVLFADIRGFTAWSSTRQPTQVFHLLESLYAAFDDLARQRGVFKVETIGDSYVAAVGLPTPRKHHAVVMARFAYDCSRKMRELMKELETTLGPVSCKQGSKCWLCLVWCIVSCSHRLLFPFPRAPPIWLFVAVSIQVQRLQESFVERSLGSSYSAM